MRIRNGADAEILGTIIIAGPLCETDEEPLVRSEAVDRLEVLVFRSALPCDVSDQCATEVGNILSTGELAVDVDVIDDDVVGELLALAVDAVFKALCIVLGPPVF